MLPTIRGLLFLLLIASLVGCMSMPQLSAQGASVQLLEQEPASSCQYLTEINGYVLRYEHSVDVLNAREKSYAAYEVVVKNKVASLGGDTAVLLARRADASIFYDVYSVYRCA